MVDHFSVVQPFSSYSVYLKNKLKTSDWSVDTAIFYFIWISWKYPTSVIAANSKFIWRKNLKKSKHLSLQPFPSLFEEKKLKISKHLSLQPFPSLFEGKQRENIQTSVVAAISKFIWRKTTWKYPINLRVVQPFSN